MTDWSETARSNRTGIVCNFSLQNVADTKINPYICSVKLLKSETMERMIKPETLAMPNEGTVGYAQIEDCNYGGAEIQPRLFDVDSYEFELVG